MRFPMHFLLFYHLINLLLHSEKTLTSDKRLRNTTSKLLPVPLWLVCCLKINCARCISVKRLGENVTRCRFSSVGQHKLKPI